MEQPSPDKEGDDAISKTMAVWLIAFSSAISVATATVNVIYGRRAENHHREMMGKIHENQTDRERLQRERDRLEQENQKLREEVIRLRNQR